MPREEIIKKLFDNMNVAKRGMYLRMQSIANDCPISHAQLELLSTIRHVQPVSFKDLAAQLQLTPGAVSQLVDGLSQHALIERQADPKDRRIQSLRISREGTDLLRAIEKRRREVMERVVHGLTDDELDVWLRIQEKMIAEFQTSTAQKQPKTGEK